MRTKILSISRMSAIEPPLPVTALSSFRAALPPRHRIQAYVLRFAGAAAVACCLPAAPAMAQTGPVSPTPVQGTPTLVDTGTTEQISQLADCGGTMYAVGTFTKISQGRTTYTRNNVFSFSASAPFTITSWTPDVNGTVNSITFSPGRCARAYLGGSFTAVGGTRVRYLAEIATSGSGSLVTGFRHSASAPVETLAAYDGHILAGGLFTAVNGSSADPYLASLNATTGADDGFLRLHIGGRVSFPGVLAGRTKVFNQQISPDGRFDLVEGDFAAVAGQRRQQIFMLDLASRPRATLTAWTSPRFDGSAGYPPHGYYYNCFDNEPFYVRAAAWAPDGQTVYLASTGFHPWNDVAGLAARGLCDAASAFTASPSGARLKWINYTGCDSLYSVAADADTVFFAGHQRWSQNADGCNVPGPGAIPAPGLEGVSPGTGDLLLGPSGASLYSRGRGLGADDMVLTPGGLWIASDNYEGTQSCGSMQDLAGICFLPYSG